MAFRLPARGTVVKKPHELGADLSSFFPFELSVSASAFFCHISCLTCFPESYVTVRDATLVACKLAV